MTGLKKRKNGRSYRLVMMLCLLTAFVCSMSCGALAVVEMDAGETCTLAIDCSYGSSALQGMTFGLYRVADGSAETGFALCGDFAELQVNLNGLSASGWKTAANTLATYITPYGIEALASGISDENGTTRFTDLSAGLYLVLGDPITDGGMTYQASPFLVALPGIGEAGTGLYDIAAAPKISAASPPGNENAVDITVLKIWNDTEETDERPERIEVTLLRDGDRYDTYTLDAGVYWRHTWIGLSAGSNWSVIENKVPEGYFVTYTADGTVLTISNTHTHEIPDDPDTQEIPDRPNPGGHYPDDGNGDTLPQTGMLWWPVYAMSGIGVLLFGLGWRDHIRHGKNDEE